MKVISYLEYAKRQVEESDKSFSGLMRPKLNSLALAETFRRNPTLLITLRTPCPQWSIMMVALWGCFSSVGTGKVGRVDCKTDGAKYRANLRGKQIPVKSHDLRLNTYLTNKCLFCLFNSFLCQILLDLSFQSTAKNLCYVPLQNTSYIYIYIWILMPVCGVIIRHTLHNMQTRIKCAL